MSGQLDTSALAEIDTIDYRHGTPLVAFCVRSGRHYVQPIELFVDGGLYWVASSSCAQTSMVEDFACAWRRCLAFIAANNLKPRSTP